MTPKSSLVSNHLTNTKAMRNSRDSLITSVKYINTLSSMSKECLVPKVNAFFPDLGHET